MFLENTLSYKEYYYDETFDEVPMGEILGFMKRNNLKAAKAFAKEVFTNQEQKIRDAGREDCNLLCEFVPYIRLPAVYNQLEAD